MKTLLYTLLLIITLAFTANAFYYNVLTQEEVRRLPDMVVIDGRPVFNPQREDYASAGWLKMVSTAIPRDHHVDSYVRSIVTNRAGQLLSLKTYFTSPAPARTPRIFPEGIETDLLVLQSETNNWGIGLVATDQGELLTIVAHQSPYPSSEVLQSRIDEAVARHRARRTAQVAATNAFGRGQLQDRIEAIEAWIRAQESVAGQLRP